MLPFSICEEKKKGKGNSLETLRRPTKQNEKLTVFPVKNSFDCDYNSNAVGSFFQINMKNVARHERVLSAIKSTNRVLYQNETNRTIPQNEKKTTKIIYGAICSIRDRSESSNCWHSFRKTFAIKV